MLNNFSMEDVADFWQQIPIKGIDAQDTSSNRFKELWKGVDRFYSFNTLARIGVLLRGFLKERDMTLNEFMNLTASRMCELSKISAKYYLTLFKPYFKLFYSDRDIRQVLLEIVNETFERLGFNGCLTLVGEQLNMNRRNATLLFSWDKEYKMNHDLDFENFLLPFVKNTPMVISMPAYEEHKMLATYRNPSYFLPDFKIKDGKCFSEDEEVGYTVDFDSYVKSKNLNLDSMSIPNKECVILNQDIKSSWDDCVVLHQECLYNAPVLLVDIIYDRTKGYIKNPLELMVDSLIATENIYWSRVKKYHDCLVESLDDYIEVVYDSNAVSISVDKQNLIKSMPAKILRNILREYVSNGRTSFENLEFKRDNDICVDNMNPNFEGRLNRLTERLDRNNVRFRLKRIKRGKFELVSEAKIKFIEN